MNTSLINKINKLEAYADLLKQSVTGLRKELEDSGASDSSTRKGKKNKEDVSAKEIAKVLGKRHKTRIKKSHQ